jgi:hypothetical protein
MWANPVFDFFEFSREAIRLAFEAHEVICMRVQQFARGDGNLQEAVAMVSEKAAALVEANVASSLSIAFGHPASGPIDALRCYGKRVAANKLRLNQGEN